MVNYLSKTENNILLGMILGDAHIRQLKKEARFEIGHSVKQKDYVFWKYEKLKRWVISKPHLSRTYDSRYDKFYSKWRFRTKSHRAFTFLRKLFYPNGKKIVPKNIKSILKSPLSLAVWYMDDGGRRNDCYGLFLNTLSFTEKENLLLSKVLKNNFSVNTHIHWIQDGFRLYVPSSDSAKFCKIVNPYILNSLKYKLPFNPVTTSFAQLDRARDRNKKSYNTSAPLFAEKL